MVRMTRSILLLAIAALFVVGAGTTPDSTWLDKLPSNDRAYMKRHVGFAPPPFTDDLLWIGTEDLDWAALRGKVVIVQTWSTRNRSGRQVVDHVRSALEGIDPAQVAVVFLHTPEGRDNVERYLERKPIDYPVAIDRSGSYCDVIGFYKKPTNIVVDRQGNVRYVGVRTRALGDAVRSITGETFDSASTPNVRHVKEPVTYPPYVGNIKGATDFRGRKAPAFYVDEWVTDRPNIGGQVLVLDFWATWCGPCVGGIPHMNEIARGAGSGVTVIGISDESEIDFEKGMRKLKRAKNITLETFEYPLALDSSSRMKSAVNIFGIPHALVVSPDGVVRWQGHPSSLTVDTVKQIVQAAQGDGNTGGTQVRRRWTR